MYILWNATLFLMEYNSLCNLLLSRQLLEEILLQLCLFIFTIPLYSQVVRDLEKLNYQMVEANYIDL